MNGKILIAIMELIKLIGKSIFRFGNGNNRLSLELANAVTMVGNGMIILGILLSYVAIMELIPDFYNK
jgi:hypothetical protein